MEKRTSSRSLEIGITQDEMKQRLGRSSRRSSAMETPAGTTGGTGGGEAAAWPSGVARGPVVVELVSEVDVGGVLAA